jgi:hypothetical protein
MGGGGVCKFFAWMHGENGHCQNNGNYYHCNPDCLQQSTPENPLSECLMWGYYTGIPTGETVESAFSCQAGSYRTGMITSQTDGALPLLEVDYRELPQGDDNFYGGQQLSIDAANYANVYGNSLRYTFTECAIMCKVYPGKQCTYFVWYGSSDPTVEGCAVDDNDAGIAICELFFGDQTPTGITVDDHAAGRSCPVGSYRHALMNPAQYQTWPVDSNGIPYTAIGGCGFGARC